MNRKVRIVCKIVDVDYTSPNSGATYKIGAWQEVYSSGSSAAVSDCKRWIENRRAIGDSTVYSIFTQEVIYSGKIIQSKLSE